MGRKGDDNILLSGGGSAGGSGMNKQRPPKNLNKPNKAQEPTKPKTKTTTKKAKDKGKTNDKAPAPTATQPSGPTQLQQKLRNDENTEKYAALLGTIYESFNQPQPQDEDLQYNAVLQFCKHWQFAQRCEKMSNKEFFGGVRGLIKLFAEINKEKTKLEAAAALPTPEVDVKAAKIRKVDPAPAHKLETIRIINWDVGMLLLKGFAFRARGLVKFLKKENFDIIMLQELNPIVAQFLENRLQKRYQFFYDRKWEKHQFFDITATLVRNNTFESAQSKIMYFPETDGQQRPLLQMELTIGKEKLVLFNTHLQCLFESSSTRSQQLKKYFNDASSLCNDAYVIISGSLHARDWEVVQLSSMTDLWKTLGTPENEFTWDLMLNKLIQIKNLEPDAAQPRKRFDRIYFINSKLYSDPRIVPRTFNLVGQDVVAFDDYCVSDHYGIVVQLDIDSKCY